jgi:Glu-tRNA(Gln) amidotransferase subunit E-like FAD-binding protein
MTTSYIEETLTQTDSFETILQQMEAYYIGTIQQESVAPLPRYISAYLIEYEGVQEQPSDFERQLKEEIKKNLNSWATSSQTLFTEITQKKLENSISNDEFERQLKQLEDKDLEYAQQNIRSAYSKIRERSEKHPEEKGVLLKLAQTVSEEIRKIIYSQINFSENLVQKIGKQDKEVYNYIESIFKLILDAIKSYFG